MEKQPLYVFTETSTNCLDIEDVCVFSTIEKAREVLEWWKNGELENGGKIICCDDNICQILDAESVTRTAKISEANLDEIY